MNYFETLTMADHAEVTAQTRKIYFSICRNQDMTGFHTPACKKDREKTATNPHLSKPTHFIPRNNFWNLIQKVLLRNSANIYTVAMLI